MTGRYATHGREGQAQPGSRGRVLANRLGIVRVRDMQVAETAALLQLTDDLLGEITEAQRFTADDLCAWHQRWLGGIYDWAGHYRNVNMSKDGFPFAAARLVPNLMADYARRVLAAHTPCVGMDDTRLVQASEGWALPAQGAARYSTLLSRMEQATSRPYEHRVMPARPAGSSLG